MQELNSELVHVAMPTSLSLQVVASFSTSGSLFLLFCTMHVFKEHLPPSWGLGLSPGISERKSEGQAAAHVYRDGPDPGCMSSAQRDEPTWQGRKGPGGGGLRSVPQWDVGFEADTPGPFPAPLSTHSFIHSLGKSLKHIVLREADRERESAPIYWFIL